MSRLSNVWVFSDVQSRLAEVIAGGAELGEKVSAFVTDADGSAAAFSYGADRVYCISGADSSRIVEDYAYSIAKVAAESDERTLILLPGTKRCKALASHLGVRLGCGVVTEVTEVAVDDDGVTAKHMVYGGLAVGDEKIKSAAAVIVLAGGVYKPAEADPAKTGEAVSVDFVQPKASVRCVDRLPVETTGIDLNKAKRIVGIGRGIAKKEDIHIAEDLCAAIGAELGCSRPIAESEKWMGHERYIGISGIMPKPELYLAVGISGQIQHMVGANEAQIIVAVNKDKNAPIFQYSDYGIVGDLYKVIPAVTEAFKKK